MVHPLVTRTGNGDSGKNAEVLKHTVANPIKKSWSTLIERSGKGFSLPLAFTQDWYAWSTREFDREIKININIYNYEALWLLLGADYPEPSSLIQALGVNEPNRVIGSCNNTVAWCRYATESILSGQMRNNKQTKREEIARYNNL